MNSEMTRRDREDLSKLTRQRERLAKSAAKTRAAVLLARVEKQLAATYKANDPRWATITAAAEAAVHEADAKVADICREQGIPEQFRPSLNVAWWNRGENAFKDRRAELRRVAQTRVAAMQAKALTEIETRSVEIQTQLLAGGLETEAAREFLNTMPTVEQLMPELTMEALEAAVPLPKLSE